MKAFTDIEQSKKLIELGIDINTADMCYDVNSYGIQGRPEVAVGNIWRKDIPCWSLAALLGILKPINENTYTINGTLDGGANISFDEVTCVMFQEKEIIDAVYRMICWLKENNKI